MERNLSKVIFVASIILGLYVGIWVMFVGGIVQIINSINPLNSMDIAIGICKIVFCEIATFIPFLGYVIAIFLDYH